MTRQVSDAVCDELREKCRQFFSSRPDLSAIDLAQHTRLADSTVRSFVNGNIPGGREVIREVHRVLKLAQEGEILQPGAEKAIVLPAERSQRIIRLPRRRHFYETQTVRRVAEILDYCVENCAIGVITAAFGAGKTEAVNAWRRGRGRKNESLMFEFDIFSSSNKVDLVQQLAKMLDLEPAPGTQSAGKVFRAVCEALQERPCLLIFDQVESVRPRVLQVLRQIWDRTREYGVGMVLLSAPILLARMRDSRMTDLGALTSRVGVWAPLGGVTKEEMAAIVKREGITEIDEEAFNLWWRATGGSMRRLMAGVELLRAKHGGRCVTEKTVSGLAAHLWGATIAAGAAA
jgi:DNA transposition AAA+ family ATPase